MKTLLEETLELRDRLDDEPIHSDHVAEMARQIFDGVRASLGLDDRARELLYSGALLHDIGWPQSKNGREHHKISARLILAEKWQALSRPEVLIVAQIARYHRRSLPKPKHEDFQKLSAPAQNLVMLLGGILRIADALDRSHTGQIIRTTARISDGALTVLVQPKGKWDEELRVFKLKSDMLQLALQREIRCEAMTKP